MATQLKDEAEYFSLSVVVPAYEEGDRVLRSVERIVEILPSDGEVIVVDDGSTDGAASRLPEHPQVRVLTHPENLGKGRALRTGIEAARGRFVAFHDVDDEYSPSDLLPMMEVFRSEEVLAATGTRRPSPGWHRMSRANRLGNRLFTAWFNRVHGTEFSDVCCGTKVFLRSELSLGDVREDGWAIDVETLARLAHRGRVVEVPVTYSPRTVEDGKKIRWYHGVAIVSAIWRVRR